MLRNTTSLALGLFAALAPLAVAACNSTVIYVHAEPGYGAPSIVRPK
jgi:hypothetical protein